MVARTYLIMGGNGSEGTAARRRSGIPTITLDMRETLDEHPVIGTKSRTERYPAGGVGLAI